MHILCKLNIHSWKYKREFYILIDPGEAVHTQAVGLVVRGCKRCCKRQHRASLKSTWKDWKFKARQTLMMNEI